MGPHEGAGILENKSCEVTQDQQANECAVEKKKTVGSVGSWWGYGEISPLVLEWILLTDWHKA